MILPKAGRVIIIDDKPSQAIPLISFLSKYNIPLTFFNATRESLPKEKFRDVRMLFLDINLNGGQQLNWETEKGMLISNITAIIEPHVPYVLFIWSVNERSQLPEVLQLFEEELKDYKPIVPPIKMEKYSLFKLQDVEKDYWVLNYSDEETIEIIKEKVSQGIATIDSFEALLKWENIVNDASALVVNDLISLANSNNNLNTDLKQIYYNLAYAYWGKSLKGKSPNEIIGKSLVSLNSILNDKIEYKLPSDLNIELLKGFPDKPTFDSTIKAQLNTKLLFSEDLVNEPIPGNLYILDNKADKENIVEGLVDRSTFSFNYCEEKQIDKKDFFDGFDIKPDHKKAFEKFAFQKVAEVKIEAVYMELELTPICDYSQGNRIFCRMVSGIILPEKYRNNQKKTASYFFVSPLFLLDGKPVNFYCDFRYIRSAEVDKLNGTKPKLRIRHLFQSDIQSQLARHVSRPGIVSL